MRVRVAETARRFQILLEFLSVTFHETPQGERLRASLSSTVEATRSTRLSPSALVHASVCVCLQVSMCVNYNMLLLPVSFRFRDVPAKREQNVCFGKEPVSVFPGP